MHSSLRHGGVALALLTVAFLGAVGCSASAHPVVAPQIPHHIKDAGLSNSKGDVQSTLSCKPANVATVAQVASGVTTSALSALSPAPLAVADTGSGTVAFFHSGSVPSGAAVAAAFTGAYQIVPDDPSLQSCDTLLADRPAAQPFIDTAVTTAVTDGMAASAATLRGNLAGIEIGDNPLTAGQLVVVLVVSGPPQGTINGHTIEGPASAIFVIINQTTMAVNGISKGTW